MGYLFWPDPRQRKPKAAHTASIPSQKSRQITSVARSTSDVNALSGLAKIACARRIMVALSLCKRHR
jgi:hypothetical protein